MNLFGRLLNRLLLRLVQCIVLQVHGSLLTTMGQRRLNGLQHIDLRVLLERAVQITLYCPSTACVIRKYDMVDAVEPSRRRGRCQGACEVTSVLAGFATLLSVDASHAFKSLFIDAVSGVTCIQ